MVKHVSIKKKLRPCVCIVEDNVSNMVGLPIDDDIQEYITKHIFPYSKFFYRICKYHNNVQIKTASAIIDSIVVEASFFINSFAFVDIFKPCIYNHKMMKYFKTIEKETGYDYRYLAMSDYDVTYKDECLEKFDKSRHKAKVIMYLHNVLEELNDQGCCDIKNMLRTENIQQSIFIFKAQLSHMAAGIFSYDKNDMRDCICLYFYILTLDFSRLLYINSDGFVKKLIKQSIYEKKDIVAK